MVATTRLEVASTHLVLLRVNINIFGDFDDTRSAFSQRFTDRTFMLIWKQ